MYEYLLYFLVFSFAGWCAEVVFYIFKTGRLVNRGFAKGPVCPIYGIGISLSYLLLGSVKSFVLLAILSMAIATAVEFSVGILFDKLLGIRLWDYREERGNIGGYVCPRFSLIWGVVSAAVIRLIPRLAPLIELAKAPVIRAIAVVLFVAVIVDIKRELEKTSRSKIPRKMHL